ncbi:hypothetical protein Ssi03_12810 [Sphaerisporangium siamense]|uniref:Uncharacterized protein n=1 Tax=Sphaerisporangium siamense TaxID=795645 RepID=A0A7W7DBJ5_9ACTN|nr:DUF5403 family protein [Sphaerisporangium siamense]MBB4702950.1 hypothetical protein [Sphaerisporangium siamense]GII83291.1 hypothetical protein Ssi03_12810 [Sphaerisporangium siamense]
MSVWVNPKIAEVIAGLPGVHAEVIATAQRGAKILKANIARRTGAMARSVRAEALGDKDAFFGVKDEGAIGYNFGHFNNWADREVPGSHVIERTISEM